MNPTNVLFIFSDEHDPRYMGCSGHPFIKTPNLDRLAARGTRFANAYTPCPVCVPARASLATGRYVHEIGYWDNAIAYDGRVPGWGHRMQAAGMRVESIGKLHYSNATDPTGFDRQQEPMHILNGIGQLWGRCAIRCRRKPGAPRCTTRSARVRRTTTATTSASSSFRKNGSRSAPGHQMTKPWLLFVGLVAPHMPLVVPQQYVDLYPLDQIPMPKLLPRDGYRRHPWIERMASHWDHDSTLGSDERRKLAIACYFGLITFLDERIGRLLAVLERTGLAETTRVIYSTDHGDNLGTRGLWNKDVLYRESTGIPLIMAGPEIAAGKVSRTNVNLVDLYPTFLRAVGVPQIEPERELPGRSLFDVANNADDADRIVLSEYHAVGAVSGAFMLVRGRYKYHYYVGYRPELFDLEADPEEMNDLAQHPAYADELAAFEKDLRRMLDPEAVDRRAKDDQNALVARHGGPEAALKLGYPGETPTAAQFHAR